MHVVFRTDASLQIGTGHIARCLTLADALREQGAKCLFVCRELEGHLIEHIRYRGYETYTLPEVDANSTTEPDLTHASLLGVDWSTDAQQTLQIVRDTTIDWLIVDHYALDYRWELKIRPVCNRMMVIDDLADRRHDCDLLLDQNYGSSAERYAGLIPGKCTQLHGPKFALLKPIYAQRRTERSIHSSKIERVMIYFGGVADPMDLTGMALRAFQVPELKKIELDIVVGSSYAYIAELEAIAATRGRACIHTQLPDLSELMFRADLAIGAGGATTWERCCLGLPSIVISIAENQRPACEALAVDDLIQYLGHFSEDILEPIREQVLDLIVRPKRLGELSEKCMKIVDGNGVNLICNKITTIS